MAISVTIQNLNVGNSNFLTYKAFFILQGPQLHSLTLATEQILQTDAMQNSLFRESNVRKVIDGTQKYFITVYEL